MSVTLATICYGDYSKFLPAWLRAARAARPDEIVVVSDMRHDLGDDVRVIHGRSLTKCPTAGMRNAACISARCDWVWLIDVDDRILPDALNALDGRECDVVQVGYVRSDGEIYVQVVLDNAEYLAVPHNWYVGTSPFRRTLFPRVRFLDIAFNDWGFWRLAARAGARFEAANRVCFWYNWHPQDSLTGTKFGNDQYVREALRI